MLKTPGLIETSMSQNTEELMDYLMVQNCADMMLEKLAKKRKEGRHGWHHPNDCDNEVLISMLKIHIEKGDMVDVMNLAAMILMRNFMFGEFTTQAPPEQ